MKSFETLRIAISSLLSNKLRSLLTMLGIIIGVASVIALQGIGQGTIDTAQKKLQQSGTNLVTVSPTNQSFGGITLSGTNSNLTLEDEQAMEDTSRITKASAVAAELQSGGQFVAGSKNSFGSIIGASINWLNVRDASLSSGEWFEQADIDSAKTVAVLGATVATDLFGDQDPVGQKVSLNRNSFTIVGVLNPKGGSGFGSLDSQIYVPITIAQRRLAGFRPGGGAATNVGKTISNIILKASDQNSVEQLINEVTDLLRERHKISGGQDDFKVVNQQDQLQAAKDQEATYNTFLVVIASISLFVGGIGIMNIMLVTVTERTREIGIRKAIGAKPLDILVQFLIESVIICLIGGLIGVAVGAVATVIVDKVYQHAILSMQVILLALGFALAVGIFFGIYPARRASRLNPIDALRYD
jgi:putative ABC transport system permease protein